MSIGFLTRDWRRKLVALLMALTYWVIRTNAENPVQTFELDVPVAIDAGTGFDVRLAEGHEQVHVVLKGPMRDLADVEDGRARIAAGVTLPEPLTGGNHSSMVQLSGKPSGIEVESTDPPRISYELVQLDRKTVSVRPRLTGPTVPGYPIRGSDITCEPLDIEIVGSAGTVEPVDHLVASVSRYQLAENWRVDVQVRAARADGQPVDRPDLTILQPTVALSIPPPEKSVGVEVVTQGEPAVGFRCAEIAVEPETVDVRGPLEILENVHSIPTEPLDLTEWATSFQKRLSLRPPEGVSPIDVSSVTASVTIEAIEDAGN